MMSRVVPRAGLSLLAFAMLKCGPEGQTGRMVSEPYRLRVATFNVEDLRTEEISDPESGRARAAAAVIQRLRPDVILVNELAYDQPGSPAWVENGEQGRNGQRFADSFLSTSQGVGLEPIAYRAFMRPSNTGLASGFDFDNDGEAVTEPPTLPRAAEDPESRRQSAESRRYGGDSWGFGTFPGQYSMALLVRRDLEILEHRARTFRLLAWRAMPGALAPFDPATGETWYSPQEWDAFRLSSKSHWDVPVRLPNGAVVHFLASHPTPPAFDGPEQRNQKRNHDEIRFWADYLDGADYIVDDRGESGGLAPDDPFVILGDLNADPRKGRSFENPIGRFLLDHPRVQGDFAPTAASSGVDPRWSELDPADTSSWGMRVDYVLPSGELAIERGAVERPASEIERISDHFPVWLDLVVPPPSGP